VEDDFRGEVAESKLEFGRIADVATNVFNVGGDVCLVEEAGLGPGVERITANDCPARGEPEREPSAFESGVAGEEDAAVLPGEFGAF